MTTRSIGMAGFLLARSGVQLPGDPNGCLPADLAEYLMYRLAGALSGHNVTEVFNDGREKMSSLQENIYDV